ncbi:MAG: hypothetical protein K1X94_00780 [Sandaracinaceae bacterium]|jgi:hypothetical protein|nr:hypothetical protein [Sandaracinaceae bacterium]
MIGSPPAPEGPSNDSHLDATSALEQRLALFTGSLLASREEAAALCEVAGRLSLRGKAPSPLTGGAREALEARLREGLGLDVLGDEASLLAELCEDEEPSEGTHETEAMVRDAMRARDRAEWIQEGARCLLGADELSEEDAIGIATFDETVRAELPRLSRWNHVRAEGLTTASSAEKRRFRWRAEGVEIDPGAWDAMSAVAALVASSPAAAARFEALVATERGLRAMKR